MLKGKCWLSARGNEASPKASGLSQRDWPLTFCPLWDVTLLGEGAIGPKPRISPPRILPNAPHPRGTQKPPTEHSGSTAWQQRRGGAGSASAFPEPFLPKSGMGGGEEAANPTPFGFELTTRSPLRGTSSSRGERREALVDRVKFLGSASGSAPWFSPPSGNIRNVRLGVWLFGLGRIFFFFFEKGINEEQEIAGQTATNQIKMIPVGLAMSSK